MSCFIHIHLEKFNRSGKTLFKKLTWEINKGENWLIKGPTGSGKTTLIEIIAGKHHLNEGSIDYSFVDGKDLDEIFNQKKDRIKYIPSRTFQNLFKPSHNYFYQQRYYASGNENVLRVGDFLNTELKELQKLSLPPDFNMSSLMDLKVTWLSNGQLKKLIIVKAILSRPLLLLLDYPYEGLDTESRQSLDSFLTYLSDHNQTQFIITGSDCFEPGMANKQLTLDGKGGYKISSCFFKEEKNSNLVFLEETDQLKLRAGVPLIKLNNINLKYRKKEILSDFSWQINKGERWALLGKNGSGKTSLLSLIFADHPQAYTNNIYLFGQKRGTGESVWEIKSKINCLLPEMFTYLELPSSRLTTAWDFVKAGIPLPYVKQQKSKSLFTERAEYFFNYFSINHLKNRYIKRLSSGEMQLLLFLRTFIRKTDLYLLDEPFQFMDEEIKIKAEAFIKNELSEDETLIVITHDPEDIRGLVKYVKKI